MLKDRENILSALREKPQKAYQLMRRANLPNEEACQSLLLKMRDEGLVKFDIHKGLWTHRIVRYMRRGYFPAVFCFPPFASSPSVRPGKPAASK